MKKSRFTDNQIVFVPKQAEAGTPEGLAIQADPSLPSARVIRSLEQIIEWRGKPG